MRLKAHGVMKIAAARRHSVARLAVSGILMGLFSVSVRGGALPATGDTSHPSSPADAVSLNALTTRMEDLQATIHIVKCDDKEMEKIGADFARSYKVQEMLRVVTLEYKQPDKLRISGKNFLGEAFIIMNGPLRCFRMPRMHKTVEDLTASPGKRQSLLEYGGLLSANTLSFMQGKFVRQDTLDEQPASVYDLTYKGVTGGSHFRVWFDPHTRLTVKREWYNFDGKLKATFYYQNPKEVAEGVWLPTQVEVKNAEGMSAALTTIDNVKINQGLSDDLFAITR